MTEPERAAEPSGRLPALGSHPPARGRPRLPWRRALRPELLVWIPECAVVAGVLWVGQSVCPGLSARPKTVLWPALGWAILRLAAGDRLPERSRDARFILAVLGWLAAWALYASTLTGGVGRMHWVMAGSILAGLAGLRWWRARCAAHPVAESLRLVAAAGAGLWLDRDFLTPAATGAEDARAYGNMMADMLQQVRAGIFPVFVGQSQYQFNGAVYTIRIAPAFHYLGALLDAVTLRALDAVALQNLLLALVGAATVLLCYLGLVALAPARRSLACLLAFLFAACPGVAGIPHDGDLYMTWMAAPLAPLLVYGLVRSFRRRDAGALACVAAGTGLAWWAHTPVAIWLGAFAAFFLLAGLVLRPARRAGLLWAAAAAAAAGLAASYPLMSVLGVPIEKGVATYFADTSVKTIMVFVHEGFPAVLLPISKLGRIYPDYQLGYSCWGLWLGAAAWALRRRSTVIGLLLALAAGLILLLLPVPGLTPLLWGAVPEKVRSVTTVWPMYRLYLPIAGATVFAAWLAAQGLMDRHPRSRFFLYGAAAVLCVWSAREADKFARTGLGVGRRPPESGRRALMPENVTLMRYAYLNLPAVPDYFTHGVADPGLECRLLRPGDLKLLAGNSESLETGEARGEWQVADGELLSDAPAGRIVYDYLPKATLQPGHRYVALFDFRHPAATAVLVVRGRDLFRVYGLPEYGGPLSFGSAPGHPRLLPLWTDAGEPEEIQFEIRAQGASVAGDWSDFGHFRLLEYDPVLLPVRVLSYLPWRAIVTAPEPSWLETPRSYQEGYQARVNGRRAQVAKSPQDLVMVAVPRGESSVKLEYYPPIRLVAAFWVSFAAAIGILAAALAALGRAALGRREGAAAGANA